MSDSEPVSAVGEFGLIERIVAKLPRPGPDELYSGDDCAVIDVGSGRTLITTDVIVENVDFDLAYCSPADVGWKAVAANVSDIAAMGGKPGRAVAALSLPPSTPISIVDGILDGMVEAATAWGVALVGGDVSSASEISLSLTVLGSADKPILRSGAGVGDAICVTGSLGGAAAGLALLRGGGGAMGADVIQRQLRPRARLEEAGSLAGAGATALIDVSDGFVADLIHLLDASGMGCEVDPASIPIDPGIASTGLDADPLELALVGGEDFELIATLPPDRVAAVTGVATRVGTITASGRTIGGRSLDEWTERGWEHLRTR